MNTILLVLAIIALVIIAATFLLLAVIATIVAFTPEFNDYDEIVECKACRGDELGELSRCWGCRYNPLYWVKTNYIGPERWKLPRLRKEWQDMNQNEATCRSCGKRILWIKTRHGKSMPCDAQPINYRINPESSTKLVTPGGDVVLCDIVKDPAEAQGWGYVPHWSTCDNPNKFRRRANK